MSYAFPKGGLPPQSQSPEGTAVFAEAYAVLPAVTHTDIVSSLLPGWKNARAWILARPLSGFAETFSQYALEISPGGGSDTPEPDSSAQGGIFVAMGHPTLTLEGEEHQLEPGSFAYIPAGSTWSLWNHDDTPAGVHWIRKRFEPVDHLAAPIGFVTHERDVQAASMPGTDGKWSTKRFMDPDDLRYDFHINIVTFEPGARIPFAETHVMEHGLYVLQGTGDYLLNKDWVPVGPGDFMWLRAFCPQACIATGDEPFRYLLYKDVNRHAPL
jgi:(S)-ureidoglycine aminohydrolase